MGALRPKRGRLATALSKNILLKEGELFIETPDGGFGSAKGKIKVGDGVTRYADLEYFLESGSGVNTRVDKSTGIVTTSGWSSTVDSDGYYTQTVSITGKSITSGTILINTVASDTSTDAQVAGYMLIKKIVPTVDGFICYATTKPDLNVSIDFFYTVLYSDTSSDITPASIGAIAEPASSGINGQVLATDGQGGTSWITVQSSGAFNPCGTVTFANLPSLSTADVGDMYNISDAFTTTADFKEGAGHSIPAGANVYKTSDSKWDILAGVTVTGVKGDKEQNYRLGNVNLTPANIGAIADPSTAGTNGQVLTSDGSGGASWQDAQSPLVFDNVPTQGSNNPVKSGGIFSTMGVPRVDTANRRMYLEGGAAFNGNIDSAPTAGSNNAVASGGTKNYVDNAVATKTEYFISSSNNATQTINIGVISENRIFLFACGFHTNYVLELIAISANGANVVHVPVANSSINSISAISYNASTGAMTITVQSNPFGYGRMTRLS